MDPDAVAEITEDIFDSQHGHPEGTTATCAFCQEDLVLDQTEGGGEGKDWGSGGLESWSPNGGTGLDYGCGDHPLSDEDGCYGHIPLPSTITEPTTTTEATA